MNSPYSPVKTTKTMKDFIADYQSNINAYVSYSLTDSQAVSRRLATETSIGKMLVDRYSQYVIGSGLSPIAAPERSVLGLQDEQYQTFCQQAESFWRLATDTKNFDHFKRHTFSQIQQIAFSNILISGDVLRQRYYDKAEGYAPKIKLISGSCVSNPVGELDNSRHTGGVLFDDSGREVGYLIKNYDDYTLTDNYTCTEVAKYLGTFEAYDLVLIKVLEANQVRGIPFLTAVRESILDAATYTKSYVTKAVVESLFTVFIEKDVEAEEAPSIATAIRDVAKQSANIAEREEQTGEDGFSLASGNVVSLAPGEKAHIAESQATTNAFDTFIKTQLSLIGGATGVPMEMLLGSYNASFSASRATIASAEKGFAIVRKEFASKFCQPEWNQVIDFGIRTGAIEAPGYLEGNDTYRKAYLSATWVGPSPVAVDPTKEITFYVSAIQSGLCTKEEAIQVLFGKDFEETAERIAIEKAIEESLGLVQQPEETQEEDTDGTSDDPDDGEE